jgi:lysine-N-methylase
MSTQLRTRVVSEFVCTTDRCEDTCCKHWSMQMDSATYQKYQTTAPELLDAVEVVGEGEYIMRKDPVSTYCVRYDGGKCGIHTSYGESYLGDACHFYPRVTRSLGDQLLMTATMSCPEVARIALFSDDPQALLPMQVERVPQQMRDVLPEGLSAQEALVVHQAFLDAFTQEDCTAEHALLRVSSVARSMGIFDRKSWPGLVPTYLRLADGRLPVAEQQVADPFNLLQALCGLVSASQKAVSPRLQLTLDEMQRALKTTVDMQSLSLNIAPDASEAYASLIQQWQAVASYYDPMLKRWLMMQISTACFPFAGLGATLTERITIIGVRFATLKLALQCSCGINGDILPQDIVVRIIQGLSRFLDHLGDPGFSLQIYAETGWDKEARLRGLIG